MFWLFFLCHFILFIEVWWLIRKKLKRKGMLLGISNFLLMIVNLIVLRVSFSLNISTISYFQDYVKEHFFLYFLWFLLNFFFLICAGFCMYYAIKRKKQSKLLEFGVFFCDSCCFFLFCICIFSEFFFNYFIFILRLFVDLSFAMLFARGKKLLFGRVDFDFGFSWLFLFYIYWCRTSLYCFKGLSSNCL